ncbi:hypothetical protein L484_010001 [Morus notabilis]|uniref:Lipase-like PAD4 n=2 Tax=Morus notabilis TaxID=981085 RepID=W9QFZ4_9ROSA|nr:hypothetical protein L484_010001 [Morus notabilis]
MVATFVASTPLVSESWRLCSLANATAPMGFVTEKTGDGVGYLAFSGVQTGHSILDPNWASLVPLETAGPGLFGPLVCGGEGEDYRNPVMVHAGLLELFMSMYRSDTLTNQILALKDNCKAIVITGHSLGGTTASLLALWLLCHLQSVCVTPPVLCITFGSPMLGNDSLSRAILRERWGGNFCHVVSKHDIMPRLLFAPSATLTTQMQLLLQHWHFAMSSTTTTIAAALLGDQVKAEFLGFIMASLENSSLQEAAGEEAASGLLFWPFGNYLLCSQEGAICLDNATSVVKMMHLMLMTCSLNDFTEDHLRYGEYVRRVSSQYLKQTNFLQEELNCESSYEIGLALALQSTGISSQEPVATLAKDCLKIARPLGRIPRLNCAKLAISLSKVNPYRAQIEWYKMCCDESDDQMGYYDAFKRRGSSKRGDQVNMNRHKLASFWDNIIEQLQNNQLPYDFHRRAKWVCAFQFYKLLVEPLDIAEYYRNGKHKVEGQYLKNGRPRRFQISDWWWKEFRANKEENSSRTKFASLTQDSCFWARVEEAWEWLANLQTDNDASKQEMWENINNFDGYARGLIELKEVSEDVLAKNSSYTLWTEELRKLSSALVCPAPLSH